jgi:hypothetical protein
MPMKQARQFDFACFGSIHLIQALLMLLYKSASGIFGKTSDSSIMQRISPSKLSEQIF